MRSVALEPYHLVIDDDGDDDDDDDDDDEDEQRDKMFGGIKQKRVNMREARAEENFSSRVKKSEY